MPDRRRFVIAAAATVAVAGGASTLMRARGRRTGEIRVDLGKDIVETARVSGVPKFAVQQVNETILYNVDDIAPGLPVRFAGPGREITWQPVFGVTMYSPMRSSMTRRPIRMPADIRWSCSGRKIDCSGTSIPSTPKRAMLRMVGPRTSSSIRARDGFPSGQLAQKDGHDLTATGKWHAEHVLLRKRQEGHAPTELPAVAAGPLSNGPQG